MKSTYLPLIALCLCGCGREPERGEFDGFDTSQGKWHHYYNNGTNLTYYETNYTTQTDYFTPSNGLFDLENKTRGPITISIHSDGPITVLQSNSVWHITFNP